MLASWTKRCLIGLAKIPSPVSSFHSSPVVCAEPLKKKKRLDPAIVRAREQRRVKKLERAIRKLQKVERPLKPLEEMEVPFSLTKELGMRKRNLAPHSKDMQLARKELLLEWCQHRSEEAGRDSMCITRMLNAQEKALKELRLESEELYVEAVQIDPTFLPYKAFGPTRTPKIKGYDAPDGEYVDTTRKWD